MPRITTSHFRNNLRRMLKRGDENKLEVVTTENISLIKEWYNIHIKRHKELGLEPIPEKIITGTLKYLVPHNKAKFFITKSDNNVHAGCLVTYHKNIVDTYIYSGSVNSYKNGAIYLLIDHILKWAKEEKFKVFNWQSSKPRNSGPYNFKMQWGSKESPYFFFTKQYGSIDKILKLGIMGVQKEYKWHFVLPYSVFDNSNKLG